MEIGPDNYNPETRSISFSTKKGARLTLCVTDEVRAFIEQCDLDSHLPFVTQLRARERQHQGKPQTSITVSTCTLRKELREIRDRLHIDKRIIPHDLRRTAAVALLEHTRDVRKVQALLGHRTLQSHCGISITT